MNRSKIEWTNETWNVITGCTKGCPYCYAKPWAYRLKRMGNPAYQYEDPFFPRLHRERMDIPAKWRKPRMVFVNSMGDIFDPHFEDEVIEDVLNAIKSYFMHTYQILTKRHYRIQCFKYPENVWLGVTQDGLTTDTDAMLALQRTDANVKFISFEPLLGDITLEWNHLQYIDWIIIGAQTKNGGATVQPKREWVEKILRVASVDGIPIFMKDNLEWEDKRQEFPKVKTPFLQTLVEG